MRTTGLAGLGVAVTVALAGCSSAASTTSGSTTPAASGSPSSSAIASGASSALDTILSRGTLRVCSTGDYLPYTHRDSKGAWSGLDVELARQLAKDMGVKAEFVATTWKTLATDYQAGRCDIAAGGITSTLDRARFAFFATRYIHDGKTPITRCSDTSKYDTIAKINRAGVRSITPIGGTNEKFARANYPKGTLVLWKDNQTIFDQILSGRADVMTTDATEARWAQKNHKGLCAVHPANPFTHDEKAWLLPRGDVVLQQYVDEWFTSMQDSGGLSAAMGHWMA